MVTQKDIAKECNVSIATVSAAFRRPEEISKKTQALILDTASKLGYKSFHSSTYTIGIFLEHFDIHYNVAFFNDILGGFISKTISAGIKIQFFQAMPDDLFDYFSLSAYLILGKPSLEAMKLIDKLQQRKIPHILVGCPSKGYPYPCLFFDNQAGVRQLLEYVLGCNHQHIAVVNGETAPNDLTWHNFKTTVENTLLATDISLTNLHFFQISYSDPQTIEIAINAILNKKPKITCIVCSNDFIAYKAYGALKKYQVDIPEGISITGFDGLSFPDYAAEPTPKLTTVYADRHFLGESAIQSLIDMIDKKREALQCPETRLFIGDSVKRL